RGCTGQCTLCADGVIYHHGCRFRSPESVVAEIEDAIAHHGSRIFFFIDANFTASPKRVIRICDLIIERGIRIIWACAARVDSVDELVLTKMKRAGCIRISYGVESGSPRVLKLMEKRVSIKQIKNAIRVTKKVGIPVYVYFVYGMPGETLLDAQMSGQLLMELDPDFVTHSIATPFPGSELFRYAESQGWLEGKDWTHYNYPFEHVMDLQNINDIIRFQSKILVSFYLKPSFIFRTIKNLKSIYHLAFYLQAAKIMILYALSSIVRIN
ncbi:MAG: radical SAM protein, partial [Candidatus Sigynarchaeota archaeon]